MTAPLLVSLVSPCPRCGSRAAFLLLGKAVACTACGDVRVAR